MIDNLNITALIMLTPHLAFFCPRFILVPKLTFFALVLLFFFNYHWFTKKTLITNH